jgi:hypothetical protein
VNKKALLTAALALMLLASSAAALLNPLNEEAAEAYFREKTAENYQRLVNEKLDALKNINDLVLSNPNPYEESAQKVSGFFVYLLEPLYVTAIITIGVYLLFVSGSPGGRTRAKTYLWTFLVAMTLVTVSMPALSILLDLSKAVTLKVLSIAPVDTQGPFVHAADYTLELGTRITTHEMDSGYTSGVERAGTPFLFAPYALLDAILLALSLRYYIVAVLSMALPLTITLCAFLPTRGIGKLLAENTLLWTFSQTAMALVLIVVAVGVELTADITSFAVPSGLKYIFELSGLLLLALTPFIFARTFSGFFSKT